MPTVIRVLVAIALSLSPGVAFGLTGAGEPIKPVTVCDILSDPAQFSGKNVAVIGIEHRESNESWLIANDCRLLVEYNQAPDLRPDLLDRAVLVEKVRQAVGSAPPDAKRMWRLVYGRVETPEDFAKDHWVGDFAEPVQLLFKGKPESYLNDQGNSLTVVQAGGGPIFVPLKGSTERALPVTLCDFLKTPKRYQGKLIRLRAALAPSGVDTPPVLSDRGCSAPVRFEGPEAPGKYNPTLSLGWYLTQRRVVEASFWGTVRQNPIAHGTSYLEFSLRAAIVEIAR
jgi:hypothetical protein